jgi:2-keto-4-pentenoate hydratase/2-oxohepta-3-ene-1,7-dioic acid hydratase in catechol pathway
MRVARVAHPADGAPTWVVVEGGRARALPAAPWLSPGQSPGHDLGALADLRLLAPVEPRQIVCVGLNYLAHVTERDPNQTVPDEPVIFMKPVSSVVGPGEPIRIANPGHRTDFEAELALVIGEGGRDIAESEALRHVFGVTCANDVSDRVMQGKAGKWLPAKGYYTYCPVGPWVETGVDLSDQPVESRLNGKVRQSQRTSAMIFPPARLIAYVSAFMALHPGDLVLTGTPENVGPLSAGDTIEIEVGGVGVLRNPVTNA